MTEAVYDTAFVRLCATDETYNGELLSQAEFDRWLAHTKAELLWEESRYLRERISDATAARNRFDPDSQQWAEFDQGIRRMAEEANRLSLRANRIESEG